MNWPTWAKARTSNKTFVTFWENVPEKVDGEWYADGHHEIFPLVLEDFLDLRYHESESDLWEYAPEWATCFAIDDNGSRHYFEQEPTPGPGVWVSKSGKVKIHHIGCPAWRETLQKRPVKSELPTHLPDWSQAKPDDFLAAWTGFNWKFIDGSERVTVPKGAITIVR